MSLLKKYCSICLKRMEWLIILFMLINLTQIDYKFINFIKSDGKGYYAYLPAVFIYKDLEYEFMEIYEKRYYNTGIIDFRRKVNGEYANMTFVGLAVLWIPFFLLAHLLTLITGNLPDGYSLFYQLSVVIAAYFYLFLGLYYLRKFLNLYGFKDWIISAVQIFGVFATPVYMYALHEAAFTHVYTFSLLIIFFYFSKRYFLDQQARHLYLAFFTLSFIVIIRPTNMMAFAAVPFLAGDAKVLMNSISTTFRKFNRVLVTLAIILAVLSIQFGIWYVQTGQIFAYTYTDEGLEFNFLDPQIINILFSYKKGFFLYTPLALIALIGFIPLFRRNRFAAWSLIGFILLFVYVLSTWSHWWFGRSYGNRGLLDYMPVFLILLAFALSMKSKALKTGILLLSVLFIVVNQIQAYQYRKYILYWDMDKESYWRVFLKTGKKYESMLWEEKAPRKINHHIKDLKNLFEGSPRNVYSFGFEDISELSDKRIACLTDEKAYRGEKAYLMNSDCNFSPGIRIPVDSLTKEDMLNLTASAWFWSEKSFNPFSLVLVIENNKELLGYHALTSETIQFETNKWQKIIFSKTVVEKFHNKNNELVFYVWYRGDSELYIDDLNLDLYP